MENIQDTVTTDQVELSQAVDETTTDASVQSDTAATSQASDGKYENVKEALRQERESKKELERRLAELQSVNARTLEVDDDGSVDQEQLLRLASERAVAQVRLEQAEDKDSEEAKRAYPELAEDPDLYKAVRAYRREMMAEQGEYISYSDAASKLVGKLRKTAEVARNAGKEEVLVSESVQKRASETLSTPSSGSSMTDRESIYAEMMSEKNTKKRDALRMKWLSAK